MYALKISLKKRLTPELWDLVSGLMYQCGTQGIEEKEESAPKGKKALLAGDEDEFEQAIKPSVFLPPQEFRVYFSKEKELLAAWKFVQPHLSAYKPKIYTRKVKEKNYDKQFRKAFKPIEVEPFWKVLAPWHAKTKKKRNKTQIDLIIEPGMAFGTGAHPTTQSCLEFLGKLSQKKDSFKSALLDFGCGSGILAIAGKKIGFKKAVGIDIDPLALQATQANAKKNKENVGTLKKLKPNARFDVIVANILKNTLIDCAPVFKKHIKPGGFLILSGLLKGQESQVLKPYRKQGFRQQSKLYIPDQDNTWVTLLLKESSLD